MSDFAVRLLRTAEDDLDAASSYIGADSIPAALRFLDLIDKKLELLSSNPYIGRAITMEEIARYGYRCLVITNYIAIYTIEENTVIVHRILHGARDWIALLHGPSQPEI
jgi:toxin ParE1/3/4